MHNDQVESCLRELGSSSREPDGIDKNLEERMMDLHASIGKRSILTRRLAAVVVVLLVTGTGFVAIGGDTAVVNYVSPSTEVDADGNIVPHDFSLGKWMHRVHDHLWDHFRSHHGIKSE
jgi:hypothetical protein